MGMATELIVYYRQNSSEDNFVPSFSFGNVVTIPYERDDESQFLGRVRRGQTLSSFSNNMYSAPIFLHSTQQSDFLFIKNTHKGTWYLREVPMIFTVGQIFPKVEVPSPTSKAAIQFSKDRVTAFIYRKFLESPVLKIMDVRDVFPDQSEAAVRNRLKGIAEFHRTANFSGYWRVRGDFNVPSLTEIREIVTPEDVCAFESGLAGRTRLEDIGIEQLVLSPQLSVVISKMDKDNPLKEISQFIEEELKLTSWNLTNNFLQAAAGQILLLLSGPGNPVGRGKGFSFVRGSSRLEHDTVIPRPTQSRSLTGTDKDLRKLTLTELREALLKFGVPDSHIKTLHRWKMVQLLREKSSQAARAGLQSEYNKFARSERSTHRGMRELYNKNAQKIFERHCDALQMGSQDILDSDGDTDEEMDDLAKQIDKGLQAENEGLEFRQSQWYPSDEKAPFIPFGPTPPPGTPVSEDGSCNRKVKRSRLVVRKVTSSVRADGSIQRNVEFIRDPNLAGLFDESKDNGGEYFQSLL